MGARRRRALGLCEIVCSARRGRALQVSEQSARGDDGALAERRDVGVLVGFEVLALSRMFEVAFGFEQRGTRD